VRDAHACWLRARALSLSLSLARSQEFDREKQKFTTDRDARQMPAQSAPAVRKGRSAGPVAGQETVLQQLVDLLVYAANHGRPHLRVALMMQLEEKSAETQAVAAAVIDSLCGTHTAISKIPVQAPLEAVRRDPGHGVSVCVSVSVSPCVCVCVRTHTCIHTYTFIDTDTGTHV